MKFEVIHATELDDTNYLKLYDYGTLVASLAFEIFDCCDDLVFDNNNVTFYIRDNFDSIIFLSRVNVKLEFRGEGYGTQLLNYFTKNLMTEPTILYKSAFDVATEGDKKFYDDIVLPKFYNKHGFKQLFDTDYYLNTNNI